MTSTRIGTLHLRYRTRRGGGLSAAIAPQLDRVLAASLGEAIDARLPSIVGDNHEVVVIRTLDVRTTLIRADWALDSRVVERVSHASIEAIASALARDDAGTVVRFADQAEFVGAFILDLLHGSAWDRWYYGNFQRYRRPDAAGTIVAVLDDNRPYVSAVFGWLARRGQLEALMALLGSVAARNLLEAEGVEAKRRWEPGEYLPLADAAFRLLEAAGWHGEHFGDRHALLANYLAARPVPPTWTDRRSLSAWVLGFVQFVARELARNGAHPTVAHPLALGAPLDGPLDWLDGPWLLPRLTKVLARKSEAGSDAPPERHVLTGGHEQALGRLAELVRRDRLRIPADCNRDATVVRLLAALDSCPPRGSGSERVLSAVIERVVTALLLARGSGLDAQEILRAIHGGPAAARSLRGEQDALTAALQAVRASGPAAVSLLHQLAVANRNVDPGPRTSGGGLFLLTRGVLDVKLHALAHRAGVPPEPLLSALAAWWLDLVPPFDEAAGLWIGSTTPDTRSLDHTGPQLSDLHDQLFALVSDQRAVDAPPPDGDFTEDGGRPFGRLPVSAEARQVLGRIGWMVLRAWSRWLPGIGGSSRSFLARNCLSRPARVHIGASELDVALEPAPLDVVLEMAGYLRRLETVPWLDGRSINFTVRRSPL